MVFLCVTSVHFIFWFWIFCAKTTYDVYKSKMPLALLLADGYQNSPTKLTNIFEGRDPVYASRHILKFLQWNSSQHDLYIVNEGLFRRFVGLYFLPSDFQMHIFLFHSRCYNIFKAIHWNKTDYLLIYFHMWFLILYIFSFKVLYALIVLKKTISLSYRIYKQYPDCIV